MRLTKAFTAALVPLLAVALFVPASNASAPTVPGDAKGAEAAPVGPSQTARAAKRIHYQKAVTPGFSVYCRWDVHLLIGNGVGEGCFDSQGDYFAIVDTKNNHKGVGVLWWGGGMRGICHNNLGSQVRPAWPTCKFAATIPEGIRIRARVGQCDQSAKRSCKKFAHYGRLGPTRVYRTTHPADG